MGNNKVVYDYDRAIEMYKEGRTAKDIGLELGVNPKTVVSNLKKAGVYVVKPRKSKVNVEKSGGLVPISEQSKEEKKTSVKPKRKSSSINKVSKQDAKKATLKSSHKDNVRTEKRAIKKVEDSESISREEKIKYCNEKYGVGKWSFMPMDEVIDKLIFEHKFKNRLSNIEDF